MALAFLGARGLAAALADGIGSATDVGAASGCAEADLAGLRVFFGSAFLTTSAAKMLRKIFYRFTVTPIIKKLVFGFMPCVMEMNLPFIEPLTLTMNRFFI